MDLKRFSSKALTFLWVVIFLVSASACSQIKEIFQPTATPEPTNTALPPTAIPSPTSVYISLPTEAHPDCPTTSFALATPSPEAEAPTAQGWYQSSDGNLWVGPTIGEPLVAGELGFVWRKPSKAQILVSGKRIDGTAPPLKATFLDDPSGSYQAGNLIFASEGCWQVQAQAGQSSLTFTIYIGPVAYPPQGGECGSLEDAVRLADAIILGKVVQTETSMSYAWQTVQVVDVWKNPFLGDFQPSLELLQDRQKEPILETGKTYLLFMQYTPWQLLCNQQTLAVINGPEASPVSDAPLLWDQSQISDIRRQVQAILAP